MIPAIAWSPQAFSLIVIGVYRYIPAGVSRFNFILFVPNGWRRPYTDRHQCHGEVGHTEEKDAVDEESILLRRLWDETRLSWRVPSFSYLHGQAVLRNIFLREGKWEMRVSTAVCGPNHDCSATMSLRVFCPAAFQILSLTSGLAKSSNTQALYRLSQGLPIGDKCHKAGNLVGAMTVLVGNPRHLTEYQIINKWKPE